MHGSQHNIQAIQRPEWPGPLFSITIGRFDGGTRVMHTPAQRRPRWRAYLLLARVSNLPTVWSNVIAGLAGASGAADLATGQPGTASLFVAASAFYTAGMFLNDAFDAPFDLQARPERPIPRGDVGRREAFAIGGALLAVGLVLLWPGVEAVLLGVALAAAIVFYDLRHKGKAFAPFVMGACRGLVYLIAAAATAAVSTPVLLGAGAMVLYVAGLTVVAKRAGANARWLVPTLIAGISILDAVFIAIVRPEEGWLALVAALGFPLTLLLQRWVPGD
jgi:hypothetical protein